MLNAYSYKEKMAAYDTTVCNMQWNVDNVWDQIWVRWESCQCSGLPHQILPKIRSFIDGQIIRSRTQAHRQLRLGCIFYFLSYCPDAGDFLFTPQFCPLYYCCSYPVLWFWWNFIAEQLLHYIMHFAFQKIQSDVLKPTFLGEQGMQ